MSDVLRQICGDKLRHVAERKAVLSFAEVDAAARAAPAPRGFRRALKAASARGYGLIAEIKKASPSKGLIRADFAPAILARAYAAGGATCLSVLTDRPYFQGEDEYLVAARTAVDLPVLRKDFMLDPYQIAESRALGADCVLLILAALSDETARELAVASAEYAMDVLVEVHDRAELDRAATLNSVLIGINNRDLKTLNVDLKTSEMLAAHVPAAALGVAESGLNRPADLARMAKVGLRCFLVGESLMRESDVAAATRRLLQPMASLAAR